MVRGSVARVAIVATALALAAVSGAAPAAPPAQTAATPAAEAGTDRETTAPPERIPALEPTTATEIQRRFNQLRSEYLDDRAASINWWLAATALVLNFFGVVVVIAGYIGFQRFRAIENEAREARDEARAHAEDARDHLEKIKEHVEEAGEGVERIRSLTRSARYDPDEVRQIEEDVGAIRQDSAASPIDRAIAEAHSLERDGEIDAAIEKWRSIANLTEGGDDRAAARAWLSVGYLLLERSEGGTKGKRDGTI